MNPYSDVAQDQLDAITDDALYNDVIDLCEDILADPAPAIFRLNVLVTPDGSVFVANVPGRRPWKVYWTNREDVVRIEAVLPHE